jgi:hypothetical protein
MSLPSVDWMSNDTTKTVKYNIIKNKMHNLCTTARSTQTGKNTDVAHTTAIITLLSTFALHSMCTMIRGAYTMHKKAATLLVLQLPLWHVCIF